MDAIAKKCPAPAGMIPEQAFEDWLGTEMPRTCGDDPTHAGAGVREALNAPHLRG